MFPQSGNEMAKKGILFAIFKPLRGDRFIISE
jgi:hypothetical protein